MNWRSPSSINLSVGIGEVAWVTIWATMRGMQSEQIGPQDYVSATLSSVMAGLAASARASACRANSSPRRRRVPAIHVFLQRPNNVDARDKPWHDDVARTVEATLTVFRT